MTLTTNSDVGQTIGLCRLLPRAFGPQNFMKNRCAVLSRLVGRTSRSAPGLLTRQASGAGTPRAVPEVRPTVRLPGFSTLSGAQSAALAFLIAAAFLAGCGQAKEKEAAGGAEPEAPTPVMVEAASLGAIDRVVAAAAVLYPVNQSNVTSKINAP